MKIRRWWGRNRRSLGADEARKTWPGVGTLAATLAAHSPINLLGLSPMPKAKANLQGGILGTTLSDTVSKRC